MPSTPQAGKEFTFHVSMISKADGDILLNPTIEQGDFQITTDGGALAQLTYMPVVKPAQSGIVEIYLSSSEVGTKAFSVIMKDQAGAEWRSMNWHESVSEIPPYGSHTTTFIGSVMTANMSEPETQNANLIEQTLTAELI